MRIVIKNEYGSFVCCGARDRGTARIQAIEGLGTPEKEISSVTFAGTAGFSLQSTRDTERTITLTADFFAEPREVQKLYRIIYRPVELYIYAGSVRRRISGIIARATETDKIIYHRWQAITLQIICSDPYFHDFDSTLLPIATYEDMLPNVYETAWYVSLPAVATASYTRRTIKDRNKRYKILLKWLMHALIMGIIGYIYNKKVDEEGYENLSSYKKNNFYNFAIGDGKFISLPKPRENALLDLLPKGQ